MEANLPNVEFHIDAVHLPKTVHNRIQRRVEKWFKGHTDVTGASIAVRELSSGSTAHSFRARVVLYHRPENIAATATGEQAGEALLSALDAAGRQLRESRDMLRERWKRPGVGTE
jgi:ribosome-associated translation inhibitor RaiA